MRSDLRQRVRCPRAVSQAAPVGSGSPTGRTRTGRRGAPIGAPASLHFLPEGKRFRHFPLLNSVAKARREEDVGETARKACLPLLRHPEVAANGSGLRGGAGAISKAWEGDIWPRHAWELPKSAAGPL
jgi:hypothetical protein